MCKVLVRSLGSIDTSIKVGAIMELVLHAFFIREEAIASLLAEGFGRILTTGLSMKLIVEKFVYHLWRKLYTQGVSLSDHAVI